MKNKEKVRTMQENHGKPINNKENDGKIMENNRENQWKALESKGKVRSMKENQ